MRERAAQGSKARGGLGVTIGAACEPAVRLAESVWELGSWRLVQLGEACSVGLECAMDMATSINEAWLLGNLRARLEAAEATGKEAASEQPLAPFPPRPEWAHTSAGAEGDVEAADMGVTEKATEEG